MMSDTGFFQVRGQLVRPRGASGLAEPSTASPAAGGPEPLTPSQLNRLVEHALKSNLPSTLLVRGEVSNFNRNRSSGHCYFTLKDAAGCVDCVMWASRAERLRFEPKDGMEVIASGAIGVYVPRGRYQIVVNTLDPVGQGALELAKRQLEEKLRREGLLDDDRKQPIPPFPTTLALITSPQAAGFADMLKVLRRCPWLRVMIYPVPVQGRDAAPAIANAIKRIGECRTLLGCVDVILMGRGGGSLEDLWAFNEEVVARAMAACPVPIVTGIGHDIDVSIADLVADHHAHTPTEAATFVIRNWINAGDALGMMHLRLGRELKRRLQDARLRLASIERHELFRRPGATFDPMRQRLDDREAQLSRLLERRWAAVRHRVDCVACSLSPALIRHSVRRGREQVVRLTAGLARAATRTVSEEAKALDALAAQLRALGPDNVLRRGYSITTLKRGGAIVRSAAEVRQGDKLVTRFADGTVESTAADPKQPELF